MAAGAFSCWPYVFKTPNMLQNKRNYLLYLYFFFQKQVYLVSMASAASTGCKSLLPASSPVANVGQCNKRLCIAARAPARPSKATCQVKTSPRAFSDSNSFADHGKALRHNRSIRGSKGRDAAGPNAATAPTNSHPALVRASESRLF